MKITHYNNVFEAMQAADRIAKRLEALEAKTPEEKVEARKSLRAMTEDVRGLHNVLMDFTALGKELLDPNTKIETLKPFLKHLTNRTP